MIGTRPRLPVLIALAICFPVAVLARSLGGSNSGHVPWRPPGLMDFPEPSPFYSRVILPAFFVAFIALSVLIWHAAAERDRPTFRTIWGSVLAALLSGLFLFACLPRLYSEGFLVMFRDMALPGVSAPFWLPLAATSRVGWGLLLLLCWFAVKPATIQFVGRLLRRKARRKLAACFSVLLVMCFTLWFVVALFCPLMYLL